MLKGLIKNMNSCLAGVAQWIEHWPVNQRVTGSIPSWGTCLVAGQVPGWGHVKGNLSMYLLHMDVSLPLLLLFFPSKIHK